ncbi:MAG: hypothetical protein Q7T71_11095, partial [Herbiconiux sp.]|nr:hypothetical protein [Herbiconiux sp.]
PAVANAAGFNPANIISDAQFFAGTSMSEGAIQAFIQGQKCTPRDGVPCLKDFRATTPTKGAQGANHCAQYTGAANESAARIIAKVAEACGISPKVLLVLMQKEQSLLTNPSAYGYERTMGWGCPDTAACNSLYFGFFNQVYRSAWQFREYTKNPNSWRYRVGNTYVQYHPNADCGGTTLNIRNQATANLYNYTPYQPNQAALANLYGTGDSCSAYGNRNFWRMYSDWFGSPVEQSPVGNVELLQTAPGGIVVSGWALDADTRDPIKIQVNVDGKYLTTTTANVPRSDIGAAYGLGDNHGFTLTTAAPSGTHRFCVWGINVGSGSNIEFGCWNATVGGNPVGAVEDIQPQPGGLGIWGWTLDPDTAAPIGVQVFVDGKFAGGGAANLGRSDIAARYPGYGAGHGYQVIVKTPAGEHRVCAYGINTGSGSVNTQLGCFTVTAGGSPLGTVDNITTGPGTVTAYGWAVDPDTTDPIKVQFNLDGKYLDTTTASATRIPFGPMTAYGRNHGFGHTMTVPGGKHRLCLWGINVQTGQNKELSCNTIEVGGSPVGAIENVVTGFASVSVYGWGYDRDTASPMDVQINVDDRKAGTGTANAGRPDLGSKIPSAYGTAHGYGVTVPAAPGPRKVCSWGINQGYGQNVEFSCARVTVSGNPVGAVEYIDPSGVNTNVWGWAIDPDTGDPIQVHVYVDGAFAGGSTASANRPDVQAKYPRFGAGHGYGVSVPMSSGAHQVCTYALNTGYGDNTLLGCNTVTK